FRKTSDCYIRPSVGFWTLEPLLWIGISRVSDLEIRMHHPGYNWNIRPANEGWLWQVCEPDGGRVVATGDAPSRAVAAALVVRALARGVIAPQDWSAAA